MRVESVGGQKTTLLVEDVFEYRGIYGGTKEGGEDIQKEEVIHFGSYKTLNGHNGGLESVMRRMDQNSIDLGILQESKINGSIYV